MSLLRLFVLRSPGVSIARKECPSTSKRTSMLSRVVPATGLAITRSSFARALTNVLFPTFLRPTIATFISGRAVVVGSSFSVVAGRSVVIASTNSSRLRFCFVLVTIGEPNPSSSKS